MIYLSAPPTLPNRSADLCLRDPYKNGWLIAHVAFSNMRSQRRYTEIFSFFVLIVNEKILGRMLKPAVSNFHPDLSAHLTDIAEKRVPAKLKPMVALHHVTPLRHGGVIPPALRAGHLEICAVALCGRRSPPKRSPVQLATNICSVDG